MLYLAFNSSLQLVRPCRVTWQCSVPIAQAFDGEFSRSETLPEQTRREHSRFVNGLVTNNMESCSPFLGQTQIGPVPGFDERSYQGSTGVAGNRVNNDWHCSGYLAVGVEQQCWNIALGGGLHLFLATMSLDSMASAIAWSTSVASVTSNDGSGKNNLKRQQCT